MVTECERGAGESDGDREDAVSAVLLPCLAGDEEGPDGVQQTGTQTLHTTVS